MKQPIVLSYVQVEPLLKARQQGQTTVEMSPDLGLTSVKVTLTIEGVAFQTGERLDWRGVKKICKSEPKRIILAERSIRPMQVLSEYANCVCSRLKSRGVPCIV